MDNIKLWDNTLAQIELSISKASFNTWFKETRIVKQDEGLVQIGVPNTFVQEWLMSKYHSNILKTLRSIQNNVRNIEYVVSKDGSKKARGTQETVQAARVGNELPLEDFYINKEDNLNPRYTFETFVVGPFNELAYAASQAVIKKPGILYNPLLIYGNTGHGKTHLMQAIGNHIKAASGGNKKIYYFTSEKFALDYINAVHNGKINNFKEKYRAYDILIMDDIQFLAGKEKSQEELFHLFNYLHNNNKQIIFSSDKHPHFIPNLEERLKSRCNAGMIVDIPKPDQESRAAILRAKAKSMNLSVSSEVIEHLAQSISGNIRELEGILNSILCQVQLKKRDLTLSEVRVIITNTAKPKKLISAKEIVKIIADFYNIPEESIYEKTRRKEVIKPRQVTMYLLRQDFNISYPSIGQKLGGRDHTTVIHSCEKIKGELKDNDTLAQEINQIRLIMS